MSLDYAAAARALALDDAPVAMELAVFLADFGAQKHCRGVSAKSLPASRTKVGTTRTFRRRALISSMPIRDLHKAVGAKLGNSEAS